MEQDSFRKLSEQIHELRNFLNPLDLKLANLDVQISENRIQFYAKAAELENRIKTANLRVNENTSKIDEHSYELAQQSERIRRLESLLPAAQIGEKALVAPVHEDKANPSISRPQNPPI